MPTYLYRCQSCQSTRTLLHGMKECQAVHPCPDCGRDMVRQPRGFAFVTRLRGPAKAAPPPQPPAREAADNDNQAPVIRVTGPGAVIEGSYIETNRRVAVQAGDGTRIVGNSFEGPQTAVQLPPGVAGVVVDSNWHSTKRSNPDRES